MKHFAERFKNLMAKGISAVILLVGISATTTVYAEDLWGCEVMLCLSNPGGPTEFAECKPPIEKLWKHLAKGHSFPTCTQANGNDPAKNFVRQTVDAYDPCSLKGLKDAPIGYIAEGSAKPATTRKTRNAINFTLTKSPVYNTGGSSGGFKNGGQARTKMCVNNSVGQYAVGGGRNSDGYTVMVFDKVMQQTAQSSRALDVYVDGNLFNRVHW